MLVLVGFVHTEPTIDDTVDKTVFSFSVICQFQLSVKVDNSIGKCLFLSVLL